MKYFIITYGCQYNEWDAARLDYALKQIGLVPSTEKEADVIFAIACSVRKSAVDRLMGKVSNWNKEEKKILISGCILPEDKKKIEAKGAIFWDINRPEELISLLSFPRPVSPSQGGKRESTNSIEELTTVDPRVKSEDDNFDKVPSKSLASSAYLPIMTGCNNFCSYCVVPYTRGREKSRGFDQIIKEFKKLINFGHKEITLLGQNVNSYKYDFAHLLKTLNNIPRNFQIRFVSNHPKDMSDEIIAAIRDLPKVKKEIHLPLQSGNNKILKAMNRPYTKEQYMSLIETIKQSIPDIKITTDVIVGFPGESEKDFQETVDVYKKVKFAKSFTNKYSPRQGTVAYKLGDPVPWQEKQRRWKILNDLANKK